MGPFEQQIVLSVVAILAFFFIIYLRRLMAQRYLPLARRCSIETGALASFGAALLPLNRGLVFALVPIAIIDSCTKHRLISRRVLGSIFRHHPARHDCALVSLIPVFTKIVFPARTMSINALHSIRRRCAW